MDPVARLCRSLPALEPEDARQYLAEAACALGPEASAAALLEAALARARADGYADPVVIPSDQDDGEGHVRVWLDSVDDQGAGAAAVFARVGAAGEAPRRRAPVSPSRVRRLVNRLLATASGADWDVLWARWGRLLAGLTPATFREAARTSEVALGTAWNIEARAKRAVRALARRREPTPIQLGFGWHPPERPEAPPEPEQEAASPRESGQQLALPW